MALQHFPVNAPLKLLTAILFLNYRKSSESGDTRHNQKTLLNPKWRLAVIFLVTVDKHDALRFSLHFKRNLLRYRPKLFGQVARLRLTLWSLTSEPVIRFDFLDWCSQNLPFAPFINFSDEQCCQNGFVVLKLSWHSFSVLLIRHF